MTQVKILIAFLAFFFFPLFFPSLHLLFFAPMIASICYKKTIVPLLWIALGFGCVVDLFASTTVFGTTALSFAATTLVIYRIRRYFFEESLTTLPALTAIFSFSEMVISVLIAIVLKQKISFPPLLLYPLLDATYAFLLFVCPFEIYQRVRKLILRRKYSE